MKRALAGALLALGLARAALAQLPLEPGGVAQLPAQPGVHWVWVNDFSFFALPDGKAFLVDGDSGRMLGLLSTGYSFDALVVPHSGGVIYSPESYFSRTRGLYRRGLHLRHGASRPARRGQDPAQCGGTKIMAGQVLTDDDYFCSSTTTRPAQGGGGRYGACKIRGRERRAAR